MWQCAPVTTACGGRDRRIPGACWAASQAKSASFMFTERPAIQVHSVAVIKYLWPGEEGFHWLIASGHSPSLMKSRVEPQAGT